jgi:zinc transporter ZupT
VALLPWLLGAALAVTHFIQPKLLDPDRVHGVVRERLASFTAGFSLAYLFLWLLPESLHGITAGRSGLFIAMLVGFTLIHLTEKYIYVHDHAMRRKLLHDLAVEHSVVFFIYYVLVGIALDFLMAQSPASATLFFLPVLLHSLLSRAALGEVHGRIRERPLVKVLLSGSALIGVALGLTAFVPLAAFDALLGLIVGAFFYIVIDDLLPERQHGLPRWFLAGAALMTSVIILIGMP